jgi:cytidylate kinase
MQKIITIDGPSGSGKGTIAQLLAKQLHWHFLDSGALYRVLGYAARAAAMDFDDHEGLSALALKFKVDFKDDKIIYQNQDISNLIRSESAGNDASMVAAIPAVRAALLDWQRAAAGPAGLVADGRDMGTVVFPQAPLKIFLTASPEERAQRRYKQLIEKGMSANLAHLIDEIAARDQRDMSRSTAPLVPAADALVIDSSHISINDVLQSILVKAQSIFSL